MTQAASSRLRKRLCETLLTLCNIPSPSYGEGVLAQHILSSMPHTQSKPSLKIHRHENSFIIIPSIPVAQTHQTRDHKKRPHIALLGHLDVVPPHCLAHEKNGRLYGAGASDMKAGLAVMLTILESILAYQTPHRSTLLHPFPYHLSFIFYQCEEVSAIRDNGLTKLMEVFPEYFKSLDLAIVAEPTDNTLQIGCVGSQHAEVIFTGKQAHSARPWNGINAIASASGFIHKLTKMKRKRRHLWGVDFYEVMTLTESRSEPGRTTVPSWWRGNVNFRFAPDHSEKTAAAYLKKTLKLYGATPAKGGQCKITSSAPAGQFRETPLTQTIIKELRLKKTAKQAWTDVAQLAQKRIPAFNYGPGLTAQCHRHDEYVLLRDILLYTKKLTPILIGDAYNNFFT